MVSGAIIIIIIMGDYHKGLSRGAFILRKKAQ